MAASNSYIGKKERRRLAALVRFEGEARQNGYATIAGIDEAGRGPLAGPVLAAACIIPGDLFFAGIDDSKKLLPKKREELYDQITKHKAVIYAVGMASHEDIDRINIYQATIQAMLQAIAALAQTPDFLLVDGLKLPHPLIPCQKIIGGDALSQSIAAASIIAKVTRDRLMTDYHAQWPQYGFDHHKGYSTRAHLEALARHGPCPIHRKSFEPICSSFMEKPLQLSLFPDEKP
jgi:ribonuclease HII